MTRSEIIHEVKWLLRETLALAALGAFVVTIGAWAALFIVW